MLKDHSELLAINVLKFIDELGKRYGIPVREHYDSLSERCHPNSAGQGQMYSTLDKANFALSFTEFKDGQMYLDYIRAPLGLLFIFERTMDELDKLMLRVAEVQHRIKPIAE